MNDYENLVRSRHSVRKYLDKEIELNKIEELNRIIKEYNQEAELNIQLILDNQDVFDKFILHYGRIQNAKSYIAMIGNKEDKSADEKTGYYGEKIVLKAQEMGLNTCWVAGTFNKKYVKAEMKNNEKLICVIAIGYGENQGNMHKSKTFEEVSLSNNAPEWYKRGIEFALLAPTAINQQKFKFELIEGNKVKATAPNGRMTKIDLGIVKYHFELGANVQNFSWAE